MVIGRMQHSGGFVSERTHDSVHPIRIGVTNGGDPFDKDTPVLWFNFTEQAFASMVAHLARRGETGETFREALTLIQETGIEDETDNVQPDGAAPAR